ncbi:MAG TPA: hypothetical protein VF017_17410 [Thermoanaerobaculia bacterium]|nr:hypothetical protein [Thermoanaerobaculia bacterium]
MNVDVYLPPGVNGKLLGFGEVPPALPPAFPPGEGWPSKAGTSEAFRETFLACLTRPEDREAARRLGNLFVEAVLEGRFQPEPTGPAVAHELRAVAADLRHLERYLLEIVAVNDLFTHNPPVEGRLVLGAVTWSATLGRVAQEIEAGLGALACEGEARSEANCYH